MKFLIAGLGSIGRRHLRNLLALGERDILLYRTHQATLPDDELAGFPVETDLQAALAHKPDAVIVSNPTALHLDVAIPAAEAGCYLFLEKPISHSLDRLDQLRSAIARTGAKVLVGFQFRFHPGLRRIYQWLNDPQSGIGQVVSARAHWGEYLPNWHPWENFRQGYAARPDLGGGVVLTLCHPLDYLRWLFGNAQVVAALTSSQGLGLPVEDTAEISLRFFSGVIASVHLDYVQRPPKHTLEIIGTEGTMRWDNADGAVQLSVAGPDGKPTEWQNFAVPESFERNVMFLDQMHHFLAICRGEVEPVCSLDDGIAALELALSVQRAAKLA